MHVKPTHIKGYINMRAATTHVKPLLFLLSSLFISSHVLAADNEKLTQASLLIKSGDFQAAYAVLEPLESDLSGDINYDYLLGVAAVESGNVTRGVFALERVIAQNPENTAARAEIAKAHLKLGEVSTSKTELTSVKEQNPSPETALEVDKMLSAIDKSMGLTTTFSAFLDLGFGHDSNVNSATNLSTVAAPGLGGGIFIINSSGQAKSDSFISMAAGAGFRHPLSAHFAVLGSISGNQQLNSSESKFDVSSLDFNVGLEYKKRIDRFSLVVQANNFDVDTESFRRSKSVVAQWQRNFDDHNQASLYTQISRLNYVSDSTRDVDRYVVGTNWAHIFNGDQSPIFYVGAYGGREEARKSQADYLSQDIYGVRLGGQLSIKPKLVAYLSSGYEKRNADDNDPTFLKKRQDDQYDVSLGLRYIPARNWIIKPQISYLRNDSGISFYSYERTKVSINAIRDFNW